MGKALERKGLGRECGGLVWRLDLHPTAPKQVLPPQAGCEARDSPNISIPACLSISLLLLPPPHWLLTLLPHQLTLSHNSHPS